MWFWRLTCFEQITFNINLFIFHNCWKLHLNFLLGTHSLPDKITILGAVIFIYVGCACVVCVVEWFSCRHQLFMKWRLCNAILCVLWKFIHSVGFFFLLFHITFKIVFCFSFSPSWDPLLKCNIRQFSSRLSNNLQFPDICGDFDRY